VGLRTRYLPWVICAATAAVGIPAFAYGDASLSSSAPEADGAITVVAMWFLALLLSESYVTKIAVDPSW